MKGSLRFQNVTLWRRTQEELSYDLKRTFFQLLQRRSRHTPRRRTLDSVSFTIESGEKIGLIGANGSGKSTILKLAAGILVPTSGSVDIQGKVTALIELGAGFDGDLTVTENIIYYGVLLGFSRTEMKHRVNSILEFAELMDNADVPLKALSSGMTARLSFAIATDVRPEILLVDEVLSVGDEAFRRKSVARMQALWNAHSTIVIVSHDLGFVAENCDRAIWLERGAVFAQGPAREIVDAYMAHVASNEVPRRLTQDVSVSTHPSAGFIDDVTLVGRELTISGWALLDGGRRLPSHVGLFVDGEPLAESTLTVQRPDVTQVYPLSPVDTVGFQITCLLNGQHGETRVDCAAFDDAEQQYQLIGDSRFISLDEHIESLPLEHSPGV